MVVVCNREYFIDENSGRGEDEVAAVLNFNDREFRSLDLIGCGVFNQNVVAFWRCPLDHEWGHWHVILMLSGLLQTSVKVFSCIYDE